ncbi:unnamed protein product [Schistocephalus solidus]|uniref:GP-PDE domain-containing protein n=1 Tax=Schistocephalus solidus TaxID=70667 RepID=A0A183SH09_SCHSO|nr:unnamed protein product [Schistocephalus solidus]
MVFEVVLALIGLYMILSFVLLRNPQLLYKRRTPAFKAAMICHRGGELRLISRLQYVFMVGSGEFLENTMDAFSGYAISSPLPLNTPRCVELGCDLIELDCQLTKDDQVVVSHDNDLSRGTGKNVRVSDLDFNDLPEYSASVKVQFGFGEEYHAKPGASRRIPLLRSVFEAFPTVPINIDVKVDNDLLVRKISDMIKEFNREELTVWGSFSDLVNKKCRSENPRIPTFFPIKEVLWIVVMYYVGLLPFLPIKDDFFEIPLIRNFFRMPNVVQYLTSWISAYLSVSQHSFAGQFSPLSKHRMLLSFRVLMSPKLFAHLKARGIPVFIWVCNTTEDFDRAFAAGGQGVVTDYPSRLVVYLNQHPEIDRGLFTKLKTDGVARRLAIPGQKSQ